MRFKKCYQNIILIIVTIFIMTIFYYLINQIINDKNINLEPKKIEKIFLFKNNTTEINKFEDNVECNNRKILKDKIKIKNDIKIYGNELNNLSVNDNCSWTYEDDSLKFNLKNYNDSIFFASELNNNTIIKDYRHNREKISFTKYETPQGIEKYIDNYINTYYNKKLEWGDESLKDNMGGHPFTLVKIKHYKNKNNVSIYHVFSKELVWTGKSSTREYINRDFFIIGYKNIRLQNLRGDSNLIKDFISSLEIK